MLWISLLQLICCHVLYKIQFIRDYQHTSISTTIREYYWSTNFLITKEFKLIWKFKLRDEEKKKKTSPKLLFPIYIGLSSLTL